MNRRNENYQHREPQISDREIERQYSKLEIKAAVDNRTNLTKTIDRNYGVTPMFIPCPRCNGQAASSFYQNTHPDLEPEYEWFVPTLDEVKKHRRFPQMLDHIFRGGLDYRKIK